MSGDKKTIVLAVGNVIKAETPTASGNIFPKEVLEKAVRDAQALIKKDCLVGTFGAPRSPYSTHLTEVSHTVKDLRVEGDNLVAKVKIETTPPGRDLISYLMTGKNTRFLPRFIGTSRDGIVGDDLQLLALDIVYADGPASTKDED
jgi:hypothetical protein